MKQGFTLVELMIVVAVIAVLSAIALPNLLRSRVSANEASAIENLRTISEAQVDHATAKGQYGDFGELTSSASPGAPFLQQRWEEGIEKGGYVYTLPVVGEDSYVCYADPAVPGKSGVRYFRVDATGVIRCSSSGQPTESDPAIAAP